SGLDKFLMGNAAALLPADVLVFAGVATAILLCVTAFYKELVVFSFDETYAASVGMNVRGVSLLLMTLIVIAVVSGIQAVGVVMMAALLITPAATARYWTDSLRVMIAVGCLASSLAATGGVLLSALLPSVPAGAAIVLCGAVVFFLSMLVAPNRGVLARLMRNRRYARNMLDDNILKAMYQLRETEQPELLLVNTAADILAKRSVAHAGFIRGMKRLERERYVLRHRSGWSMTPEGVRRGARITRLHRLWEVYLSEHLNIAPDHVHDDAESVEHIITPDIEQRLQEFLDYPKRDPHQKHIPY
ncbi:MAG: metal ABC transporter permease, partial [Candidatus Kapabacteria bacterium]|nr:metal ABC transporter permease [Candidatus Kapabacteria bacterium]